MNKRILPKKPFFRMAQEIKIGGIQATIMFTLTLVSITAMLIGGFTLYGSFTISSKKATVDFTETLMEQTKVNLEEYLVSMREISDVIYYNVIYENDISNQKLNREMSLLYESNKSKVRSIALYDDYGSLLAAEPVANQKEDPDITNQDWFIHAVNQIENLHFSIPHIQKLFVDTDYTYHWVISLSRAVDINDGDVPRTGVLLIDMNYAAISEAMEQINQVETGQYYYLCDKEGKMIYHPKQMMILEGCMKENNKEDSSREDGIYEETFQGSRRTVSIKTISYTGWKLVGVIPRETYNQNLLSIRFFAMEILLLTIIILLAVNRLVSKKISKPILCLNESVKNYEAGDKPQIYIGGSSEIQYLGRSIQNSYEQIEILVKRIIYEQNERRKSELEVLQSQINPHFLYNTLDSITWMIEGEKNDEAVFMISELARLFRISLSKGRTIISVQDEMQHASSYMNIQKARYKDRFKVLFDMDAKMYEYCIAKLVIQPLLENAIYYGVGDMDEEDEGAITITGRIHLNMLYITVSDNGNGMPKEMVDKIFTENQIVHKRGSGVGLVNVQNRIQLLFGKEFGLTVESELDCGTSVTIRIPAIAYTKENRIALEGAEHEKG